MLNCLAFSFDKKILSIFTLLLNHGPKIKHNWIVLKILSKFEKCFINSLFFKQRIVHHRHIDFFQKMFPPLNVYIVAKFIQDPIQRLLEAKFHCSYLWQSPQLDHEAPRKSSFAGIFLWKTYQKNNPRQILKSKRISMNLFERPFRK